MRVQWWETLIRIGCGVAVGIADLDDGAEFQFGFGSECERSASGSKRKRFVRLSDLLICRSVLCCRMILEGR